MDVLFDSRWGGSQGIDRFAAEMRRRIPGMRDVPRTLRLFHPLETVWLSTVIARQRPDVYFSPGFNPPLYSPAPFVFTIYDLMYVQFPDLIDPFRKSYFQHLVRPRCRRAACVLTTSEISRELIVEWAGVPPGMVRNVGAGVDPQFNPDGPKHDAGFPYVFYIGQRGPHKNLPRLIKAFSRSAVASECRLLLSGQPDPLLMNLARDAGISEAVEFAGLIPEQDLPSYFRGARALAIPSLVEGFGLPALEALASGTPVLASNSGSLPEVVGDAGILSDPLDTESIAAGLHELVFNETRRNELIRAGLEQAKRFSWEQTAEKVHAALRAAAAI